MSLAFWNNNVCAIIPPFHTVKSLSPLYSPSPFEAREKSLLSREANTHNGREKSKQQASTVRAERSRSEVEGRTGQLAACVMRTKNSGMQGERARRAR